MIGQCHFHININIERVISVEKTTPLYAKELYSTEQIGNATVRVSFAEAYSNEKLDQNRKNLENAIRALYENDGVIIGGVNFNDYPANTTRVY